MSAHDGGIAELHALALDGSFDHAPHVAMLGMAVMRGWLAAAVRLARRRRSRQSRCQKSACRAAASSSSNGPITSVRPLAGGEDDGTAGRGSGSRHARRSSP